MPTWAWVVVGLVGGVIVGYFVLGFAAIRAFLKTFQEL